MEPLNPRLYDALQLKYGDVDIVNPGQHARVTYRPDYSGGAGKTRLSVEVDGGEYYKVRCQHCRDWKQRLYFSHLWGTQDKRTGRPLLHIVTCFNEDCVDSVEVQRQLFHNIFSRRAQRRYRSRPTPAPAASLKTVPPCKIVLPRNCEPVHTLEPGHRARLYLEQRGFSLEELWHRWRVRYCERDFRASLMILDRIVIPIYDRDVLAQTGSSKPKWKLAGWQARSLTNGPGTDAVPKYLTAGGYQKSGHLYGLPHAFHDEGAVVLVEGVTDVWRLARNAVASLGKTLSVRQREQLVGLFRDRPIVVAYDPDACDKAQQACEELRRARRDIGDDAPVRVVTVPDEYEDIGACPREVAWQIVNGSIAER